VLGGSHQGLCDLCRKYDGLALKDEGMILAWETTRMSYLRKSADSEHVRGLCLRLWVV